MALTHDKFLRVLAKALRYLSLSMLPALASESKALNAPQRRSYGRIGEIAVVHPYTPRPYLASLGPIPLRFETAPDISPDGPPPPPIPIKHVPPPIFSDDKRDVIPPVEDTIRQPVVAQPSVEPQSTAPVQEKVANPVSILPDDTHRELRPEDVLPFFLTPTNTPTDGSHGSVNVVVPLSSQKSQPTATQPPSSATYQLK